MLALFCGLLVPAHLRAVDSSLVRRAGLNTVGPVAEGIHLAHEGDLGAVRVLQGYATQAQLAGRDQLDISVARLVALHPDWLRWGGGDAQLESLFDSGSAGSDPEPLTHFIIRLENRNRILDFLNSSPVSAVHDVLRTRALTRTTIFSASSSAAGQAFDAAVSICGLLLADGKLTPSLGSAMRALARQANQGDSSQPFEESLMDLLSLGQRMNWDQLTVFVAHIDDPRTLHVLADQVRRHQDKLATLFTVVAVSAKPGAIAQYLLNFSQSGLNDLDYAARCGTGGLDELLARNQPLYVAAWRQSIISQTPAAGFFNVAVECCRRTPLLALVWKWLFYLVSGFLLALAMHFARPVVSSWERPLQVRGFHLAREVLFALGFLLVVLLASEPFLAQDSQKTEFAFRLRLPMAGGTVPAGKSGADSSFMNHQVLLTMLLFFVLQALLYVACIVKLAEIRRQRVGSRIKLKLLENEDHLFDAGLYLGFVGTIISLILVSVGVFKQPSLMAAYSSTSFGIIFVSAFKIFHLRPARRKLLIESETASTDAVEPIAASPVTASV